MIIKSTVYIIDDELICREKIKKLINSLYFNNDYLYFFIHPLEDPYIFFNNLKNLRIQDNDVFIIDIDLKSSYSGIDVAKKIRKKNTKCFILFLTNSENKGIDIINQQINPKLYIIKDLNLNFIMLEDIFYTIKKDILYRIQEKDNYISFKKFGKIILIKYEDIIYIKSMSGIRNTLVVYTFDSEYIVEGTINKLKKTLNSPYLYTDLRLYIINLNHVVLLDGILEQIIFDDNKVLKVGKRVIDKLKKVI